MLDVGGGKKKKNIIKYRCLPGNCFLLSGSRLDVSSPKRAELGVSFHSNQSEAIAYFICLTG